MYNDDNKEAVMDNEMDRKTPLFDRHVALGGRMVPFAGWLLPERYGAGVIGEHMAVRREAGLFDVSHMGEFTLCGADALANLQRIMTNDFSGMKDGQTRYTLMCDASGGALDDLLVYRLRADRYMLVVNASNIQKDAEWIVANLSGDAAFADVSDGTAQIALQGPAAGATLSKLTSSGIPEGYYSFIEGADVGGARCLVSRTGYTGEDGFEIYCEPGRAADIWDALLEAGRESGVIPCGLGARDTLRLEAAMPLYGHELDAGINPFEAALGFAVKMKKGDFIGKSALESEGARKRTRVGLRITGRGIARQGHGVLLDGAEIGRVTSGTFCPRLEYAAAMALIDASAGLEPGMAVTVDIRGKPADAVVTELPFYKRKI